MEQFMERANVYEENIKRTWQIVNTLLQEEKLSVDIRKHFDAYISSYEEFRAFLIETRSVEAEQKLFEINQEHVKRLTLYDAKVPRPTRSVRSEHSYRSSLSESIVLARAKAEAAKVKLRMTEEERKIRQEMATISERQEIAMAVLKKEKEQLGIQLSLLAQKKEVAAAEAELQALNEGEPETKPSIVDEELVQKRTAQYIPYFFYIFDHSKYSITLYFFQNNYFLCF